MQFSALISLIPAVLVLAVSGCQHADGHIALSRQPQSTALSEINAVLDSFHDAAAVADLDRYFGHLTEDAVFLGSDATERWPREAFRAFAEPYFQGETAWAYTPRDRSVSLSDNGRTAWFDETAVNDKYGALRGSGVLVFEGDRVWRIAQYNLVFTVPNGIAGEVVEMIKSSSDDAER